MSKYRKKPVVIEAFRVGYDEPPEGFSVKSYWHSNIGWVYVIETLEFKIEDNGYHYIRKGDYIIKGINGEIYPCKADIFEKTYERVGE